MNKIIVVKHLQFIKLHVLFLLVIGVTSCVAPEKIIYFQEQQDQRLKEDLENFEPTLQIGDIVNINVASVPAEAAVAFNLYENPGVNPRPLPYIINADGEINFPVIGKLKIVNLTTKEVTNKLVELLLPYLSNAIVNVRLVNFRVSVLGEVRNPGSYIVENERISLLDAISLAGDLTIQGKRSNISLIRERDGKRTITYLDLTSQEIFNSPYFYLAQNDIVYVEPNKTRINSSSVGANTAVVISSLTLLVSLIAIITR